MQDNLSSPTTASCDAIPPLGKNSAVTPPSIGSPHFARRSRPAVENSREEASGRESGNLERRGSCCRPAMRRKSGRPLLNCTQRTSGGEGGGRMKAEGCSAREPGRALARRSDGISLPARMFLLRPHCGRREFRRFRRRPRNGRRAAWRRPILPSSPRTERRPRPWSACCA